MVRAVELDSKISTVGSDASRFCLKKWLINVGFGGRANGFGLRHQRLLFEEAPDLPPFFYILLDSFSFQYMKESFNSQVTPIINPPLQYPLLSNRLSLRPLTPST